MAETQNEAAGALPPVPNTSRMTMEEREMRLRQVEDEMMEILSTKGGGRRLLEEAIGFWEDERWHKGMDMEDTCHICLTTKFDDGIGHKCNYCFVRFCARCGRKVTLRSLKVIWECISCQKDKVLRIKSGQWLHSDMAAIHRQIEADVESSTAQVDVDKRPKLQRAHSEGNENVAQGPFALGFSSSGSLQQIHRTNSQRELRRRYSQEQDSAKQEPCSDSGRYPDRSRPSSDSRPPGDVKIVRPVYISLRNNYSRLLGSDFDARERYDGCSGPSYDRQDRYSQQSNLRRGKDSVVDKELTWKDGHPISRKGYHGGDRRYSIRDQTWFSQEEDSRTTYSDSDDFTRRISQESLRDPSERTHRDTHMGYGDWKDPSRKRDYEVHSDDTCLRLNLMRTGADRRNHLEPGYASDGRGRSHNNRKKVEPVVWNDSLSSDQSESDRPPPPKPHKNKRDRKLRQKYLSSSDDEIRSTPECSSC